MDKEELKSFIDKLQEQGQMSLFEGATDEQLSSFEKENNVKLPNGYRAWLSFCDGGELFLPAGIQLYGVAHKPLIDVNDNDRPDDNYIVIGALANGDPLLCKKNSERISIYNHEAGRIEDDETYPDFDSFLGDLSDLLGIGG